MMQSIMYQQDMQLEYVQKNLYLLKLYHVKYDIIKHICVYLDYFKIIAWFKKSKTLHVPKKQNMTEILVYYAIIITYKYYMYVNIYWQKWMQVSFLFEKVWSWTEVVDSTILTV